jgi:hypothetical protein
MESNPELRSLFEANVALINRNVADVVAQNAPPGGTNQGPVIAP